MFAFSGRGTRLGAYAEPWDAPSITGQLQVTTDQLRFSVPGYNFAIEYAADASQRAAFEAYSFGPNITIYGSKLGYGIYKVTSWDAGTATPPTNGNGGTTPGTGGNGGTTPGAGGGTTPGAGGGTTPGAGGGTTPAAASIPWLPILGAGALLMILSGRKS